MSELCKALIAAEAEFPAIPKDANNPHFNSRYTTLDKLIEMTRPVLCKHGLVVQQVLDDAEGVRRLSTRLVHVSGEMGPASVITLRVDRDNMQGLGSAITYARRYGYACTLGLASDEDDDGNASSPRPGAKPASKPPAKAASPPPASKPAVPPPFEAWQTRIQKCKTEKDIIELCDKVISYQGFEGHDRLKNQVLIELARVSAVRIEAGDWSEGTLFDMGKKLQAEAERLELLEQGKEAFGG